MTQSLLVTYNWSFIALNWAWAIFLVSQHPKLQFLWRNLILIPSPFYLKSLWSQETNLSRFINLSIYTQHPQTTYYNRFNKQNHNFPPFFLHMVDHPLLNYPYIFLVNHHGSMTPITYNTWIKLILTINTFPLI